jgi:hypothetical protein
LIQSTVKPVKDTRKSARTGTICTVQTLNFSSTRVQRVQNCRPKQGPTYQKCFQNTFRRTKTASKTGDEVPKPGPEQGSKTVPTPAPQRFVLNWGPESGPDAGGSNVPGFLEAAAALEASVFDISQRVCRRQHEQLG